MRSFEIRSVGAPATLRRAVALWAASTVLVGCGLGDQSSDGVAVVTGKSVVTPQTPLDGNAVPKFVDALPTFNGRRSDGTTTQQVTMQEFQQKILPNSVYAGLAAPFNNGTFLWGYNIKVVTDDFLRVLMGADRLTDPRT